jgi:hypothetical protein
MDIFPFDFVKSILEKYLFILKIFLKECFTALHPPDTPASEHVRHCGHGTIWGDPLECVMVEAIVKLLRETSARLIELSSEGEAAKRPKWLRQLEAGREIGREVDPLSDERRMLSRFGIWLMAAHCPPNADATPVGTKFIAFIPNHWHLFRLRLDIYFRHYSNGLPPPPFFQMMQWDKHWNNSNLMFPFFRLI